MLTKGANLVHHGRRDIDRVGTPAEDQYCPVEAGFFMNRSQHCYAGRIKQHKHQITEGGEGATEEAGHVGQGAALHFLLISHGLQIADVPD